MSRRYYAANPIGLSGHMILDLPLATGRWACHPLYDNCGHEFVNKDNIGDSLYGYGGEFGSRDNISPARYFHALFIKYISETKPFPYWRFEKGALNSQCSFSFLIFHRAGPRINDICWELCSMDDTGNVSKGIVYCTTYEFRQVDIRDADGNILVKNQHDGYVEHSHFITVTIDETAIKLYRNGVLVDTKLWDSGKNPDFSQVCGVWPLSNAREKEDSSFSCFQNYKLFNKCLSQEEVQALWQYEFKHLR